MPYKRAATRSAVKEYQALVKIQRAMPLDQQWTMGALIKQAQAKAQVEIELERYGI